jgi:hypothetical protein
MHGQIKLFLFPWMRRKLAPAYLEYSNLAEIFCWHFFPFLFWEKKIGIFFFFPSVNLTIFVEFLGKRSPNIQYSTKSENKR